jgi:hypothetical protein
MDEQNLEAELDDRARSGRVPVAEAGLPAVLASLRGLFEFYRFGIPDIGEVPVTDYRGFSDACSWNAGIPGTTAARILAFPARLICKFWWESSPAMYAAVGLLVVAATWNAWPRRVATPVCCGAKQIN